MKAVVFHGKNDLRVQDVEEPLCTSGRVKVRNIPVDSHIRNSSDVSQVKPAFCGICGTGKYQEQPPSRRVTQTDSGKIFMNTLADRTCVPRRPMPLPEKRYP